MVQLDDLNGVEKWCNELAETHQQHRRDREVRRHDGVTALRRRRCGGERGEIDVRQAGRADDRVDALSEQHGNVRSGGGGVGEVDDHLAFGGGELVDDGGHGDPPDDLRGGARVDRGDEIEGVVAGDRSAGSRAHPPPGPTNADADHDSCSTETSHRWCTGSWTK